MYFNAFFFCFLALAMVVYAAPTGSFSAIEARTPQARKGKGRPVGVSQASGSPVSSSAPARASASAAPSVQPLVTLGGPFHGCKCGDIITHRFSAAEVEASYARAISTPDKTLGPASDPEFKRFPHFYGGKSDDPNVPGVSFPATCPGARLYEFPLWRQPWNGLTPKGGDRVVFTRLPSGQPKFCGCMYHYSWKYSAFKVCDVI